MQISFLRKSDAQTFCSLLAAQSGILDRTICLIMKNQTPTKKVCIPIGVTAPLPTLLYEGSALS